MEDGNDRANAFGAAAIFFLLFAIIIIAYFFSLIRIKENKEQELSILKIKIQENSELNEKLEKKLRRYLIGIRIFIVLTYFLVNLIFFIENHEIETLLAYNSVGVFFISAVTFLCFGSFSAIDHWWKLLRIRLEAIVYEKSPDLKKLINEDNNYKEILEKEIKELNMKLGS